MTGKLVQREILVILPVLLWLRRTCSALDCNPHSMFDCTESGVQKPLTPNATTCIPVSWKCDQVTDCWNNADEGNCPESLTCMKSVEFGCHDNSRCLPVNWLCDGEADCADKSDEDPKICNAFNCTIDQFTCMDLNGTKRCLPLSWVCDGTHDCVNDEFNCNTTCTPNEFTCPSGKCINSHWVCDGNNDCLDVDASDELNCTGTESGAGEEFNCTLHEIYCHGACIPTEWGCDVGGSPTTTTSAPVTPTSNSTQDCSPVSHYLCSSNRSCIPKSSLCNQVNDCGDWEDERNCHTDECVTNNGNCTQLCVDTPNGHHCSCKRGYQMMGGSTCVDIDECREGKHNCSQLCLNELGSFKCECYEGYLKDPLHPTSCKSIEGHASLLYFYQGSIRKLSLDHLKMTLIVDNILTTLTSIDYQFRTGMIFWSENWKGQGLIYKSPIDEGNTNKILIQNLSLPVYELALDWVNYHLYVVTTNVIHVATIDGKFITTLLHLPYTPKSVVLNPMNGWMYWLSNCSLETGTMDGQNVSTVAHLHRPQAITMDYLLNHIYYVDSSGLNVLQNGQSKPLLKGIQSTSITIFEDWIYVFTGDAIQKINKLNGHPIKLQNLEKPLRSMKVYHTYRQGDNRSMSSCQPNHCSHLCLPNPFSFYSCHCPEGLLPNGMNCVAQNKVQPKTSLNVLLFLVMGGLGGVCVAIIVVVYRRNQYTKMQSGRSGMSASSSTGIINFDNPVYHSNKMENPKILSLLAEDSDELPTNPMVLSSNEYV